MKQFLVLSILLFLLISACAPPCIHPEPDCKEDSCEKAMNDMWAVKLDDYQTWPYTYTRFAEWKCDTFLTYSNCTIKVDPTQQNCVSEFNIHTSSDSVWMRFYPFTSVKGDLITPDACSDTSKFNLIDSKNIVQNFGYSIRTHRDTFVVQLFDQLPGGGVAVGQRSIWYKSI